MRCLKLAYDEPDATPSTPPMARVTFPGPAALFTTRNVTIRGTAQSPHAIARVTVNGVPATSPDGFVTWAARLTLPPGRHAVAVSTEDVWGHRDAAAATVTVVVGALLREPWGMARGASGHLVVAESALRAVIRLDPVTGVSAIVADGTTCPATPFRSPADIAVEAHGDLIVADRGVGLIRVDPVSGVCRLVSETRIGEGPRAASIVIEADGQWLVISGSTLVRVDPGSGQRTVLWDASTMRDEPPCAPHDLFVDPLGQMVVTNQSYPSVSVVQLDPQSGQRAVLSGPRLALLEGVGFVTESLIGSGPLFGLPAGIVLEASGPLVVVDSGRRAVFCVDPRSGDRTILSDDTTGRGPLFASPEDIVVATNGQLLVTDGTHGTVIRVDPASGDRTVLQFETGLGGGPTLAAPTGIAVEAHGDVVVADGFDQRTQQGGFQAVVRVNPLTGDRTVVSDSQIGAGPLFVTPRALAIGLAGQVVVTDTGLRAVLRIDAQRGDRAIIST